MKCKYCLEDIPDAARRCSKCHADLRGTSAISWMKGTAIAGAGLFAATVITGSIVPGVSAELDHDRTLREERLRIAHTIIEQGTHVEIDINNLRTTFAVFFKDSIAMSPRELQSAQESMRPVVAKNYLEFERVAWWWYRTVQRDARFPEPLEDSKAKELDNMCDKYTKTLGDTTSALNDIWTAVLRERPSKDRIARVRELSRDRDRVLERLGTDRRDLISQMAGLFERPQPHRWFMFWQRNAA